MTFKSPTPHCLVCAGRHAPSCKEDSHQPSVNINKRSTDAKRNGDQEKHGLLHSEEKTMLVTDIGSISARTWHCVFLQSKQMDTIYYKLEPCDKTELSYLRAVEVAFCPCSHAVLHVQCGESFGSETRKPSICQSERTVLLQSLSDQEKYHLEQELHGVL